MACRTALATLQAIPTSYRSHCVHVVTWLSRILALRDCSPSASHSLPTFRMPCSTMASHTPPHMYCAECSVPDPMMWSPACAFSPSGYLLPSTVALASRRARLSSVRPTSSSSRFRMYTPRRASVHTPANTKPCFRHSSTRSVSGMVHGSPWTVVASRCSTASHLTIAARCAARMRSAASACPGAPASFISTSKAPAFSCSVARPALRSPLPRNPRSDGSHTSCAHALWCSRSKRFAVATALRSSSAAHTILARP